MPPLQEGFDNGRKGGSNMDSFPLPPTKSLLLMVMITMPVSWEMSLVFIECSQGKKVVSLEEILHGDPWL